MNQNTILQKLIHQLGPAQVCQLLSISEQALEEALNADQNNVGAFYEKQIKTLSQQVEWTTTQLNQVIERNNFYLGELNEFEQRGDGLGQAGDEVPIPMDILESLDQVISEGADFRSQTAHHTFDQHIKEEAKAQITEIKRIKTNSDWRVIGIAASIVACFLSVLLVWQNLPKAQQEPQPVALKVNKQVERTLPELVIKKAPKKVAPKTQPKVKVTPPPVVKQPPVVAPKKVEEKELVAFADNPNLENLIAPKETLPANITAPSHNQVYKLGEKITFANSNTQKALVKVFNSKGEKQFQVKLQKGKIPEIKVANLPIGKYYLQVRIQDKSIVTSFLIHKK